MLPLLLLYAQKIAGNLGSSKLGSQLNFVAVVPLPSQEKNRVMAMMMLSFSSVLSSSYPSVGKHRQT